MVRFGGERWLLELFRQCLSHLESSNAPHRLFWFPPDVANSRLASEHERLRRDLLGHGDRGRARRRSQRAD